MRDRYLLRNWVLGAVGLVTELSAAAPDASQLSSADYAHFTDSNKQPIYPVFGLV